MKLQDKVGIAYRVFIVLLVCWVVLKYADVPAGEVPFAAFVLLFGSAVMVISDSLDIVKTMLRRY